MVPVGVVMYFSYLARRCRSIDRLVYCLAIFGRRILGLRLLNLRFRTCGWFYIVLMDLALRCWIRTFEGCRRGRDLIFLPALTSKYAPPTHSQFASDAYALWGRAWASSYYGLHMNRPSFTLKSWAESLALMSAAYVGALPEAGSQTGVDINLYDLWADYRWWSVRSFRDKQEVRCPTWAVSATVADAALWQQPSIAIHPAMQSR